MKETSSEAGLNALRELYPQLTEAELMEAKEQIDRYLKVVDSIIESLQNNPELQAEYEALKEQYRALTQAPETDTFNTVEY